MGNSYSLRTGNSIIYYDKHEDELGITAVKLDGSILEIPAYIDGIPVTVIEKKAFLGLNHMVKCILPETIRLIQSFAFGQCGQLLKVVIKRNAPEDITGSCGVEELTRGSSSLTFEQGAFVSCRRLRHICIGRDEESQVAALLGAIPYKLEAEYLLMDSYIGSNDWFNKWDQKLLSYLAEDNEEGYINLVLCGEEDIKKSPSGFASEKKRKKAALCFLRLMNPDNITDTARSKYERYILKHIKGSKSEEAWDALRLDFVEDMDYFKFFAELGGINKDNIDGMLKDLGEDNAEAKAFLMRYKNENFGENDIFDAFSL